MNKKLDPTEVQDIIDEHVPGIAKALEENLVRNGLLDEPSDGYRMMWFESTPQSPENAQTRAFLDQWITPHNGPFKPEFFESSDRVLASKHNSLTAECKATRAQQYHESKLARNGFHGAHRPRDYQIPILTSLKMGNGLRTTGFDLLTGKLSGGLRRGELAALHSFPMPGFQFPKTDMRTYMYGQALKKGLKIGYVCDETMEADTANIWDAFLSYSNGAGLPGRATARAAAWDAMEGIKDFHYFPLSRLNRRMGMYHPKLPKAVIGLRRTEHPYLRDMLSVEAPIGAYSFSEALNFGFPTESRSARMSMLQRNN